MICFSNKKKNKIMFNYSFGSHVIETVNQGWEKVNGLTINRFQGGFKTVCEIDNR
jgi:hypothetical protein